MKSTMTEKQKVKKIEERFELIKMKYPEMAHARLEWSNRMTATLGRAWPNRINGHHLIKLSLPYLRLNEYAETEETLLHEAAHCIADTRHKARCMHDRRWKAVCVEIGCRPQRCAPPDVKRPPRCARRRTYSRRMTLWAKVIRYIKAGKIK